jgi:hypothetical protein
MAKIEVNFREQEDVKYELTYTKDGVVVSVYSKTDKINLNLSKKQFEELFSVVQCRLPQEQIPDDTMTLWKELAGIKITGDASMKVR